MREGTGQKRGSACYALRRIRIPKIMRMIRVRTLLCSRILRKAMPISLIWLT